MNSVEKMTKNVLEFTKAYGFQIGDNTTVIDSFLRKQRYDLIHEEVCEFYAAKKTNNRLEMLDALCDIMYVTLGTYITFGIKYSHCLHTTFSRTSKDKLTHGDKEALNTYLYCIVSEVLSNVHELSFLKFNEAFEEVHRSNMSKSCNTLDEVYATMAQPIYKDIPFTHIEKNGKWYIYKIENGKLIKSISYNKANLNPFI